MRKNKGEYGYRGSRRKNRLFITLLLAAGVAAQLIARSFTDNQAADNILTVMAILTVLPMANMASPLIASWKYPSPPESFHQKLMAYEPKFTILYDLILTSKEAVMPMDAIVVHPKGVIAYCTGQKVDAAKAEKFLNQMLSANRLDPHAKVIKDEAAFFRRIALLAPASEYEDDGSLPYVTALLKNLSM